MNIDQETSAHFANLIAEIEQSSGYAIEMQKIEIAEQIWKAMQGKGVTKRQLAKRLGIKKDGVKKILQGAVDFTPELLGSLSAALGVEIS